MHTPCLYLKSKVPSTDATWRSSESLGIAGPCGELQAFRPAGRRDKTTIFYFPIGTHKTMMLFITENAQH